MSTHANCKSYPNELVISLYHYAFCVSYLYQYAPVGSSLNQDYVREDCVSAAPLSDFLLRHLGLNHVTQPIINITCRRRSSGDELPFLQRTGGFDRFVDTLALCDGEAAS
jgi:hypothetical protein